MYRVELSQDAQRFYEQANAGLQRRLEQCFNELRTDPRRFPQAVRLKGALSRFWRYRVGDYRVVYFIDQKTSVVVVTTIAHRRDVYE